MISQRTILLDTTPPKPRVRSIGPSKAYGPELLPEPGGAPAQVHFLPAQRNATAQVFKTAPGTPRLVRTDDIAQGADEWDWDGDQRRRPPGLARDLPGRAAVARPGGQPRDVGAAGRQGLPILDRGRLPGHGGITVRYLGAQTPATRGPGAAQTVPIQVDARDAALLVERAPRRADRGPRALDQPQDDAERALHGAGRHVGRLRLHRAHRDAPDARGPPGPVHAVGRRHRRQAQGRAGGPALHDLAGRATPATTTATARPTRSTSAARSGRSGSGPATGCRPASPTPRRRCCSGSTATATATTSRPTSRSPPGKGPALAGHHGVLIPGDARWLPAKVRASLRAFARAGGHGRLDRDRLAAPLGRARRARAAWPGRRPSARSTCSARGSARVHDQDHRLDRLRR